MLPADVTCRLRSQNAGLGGTALKKGKPENDPAQVQQTLLSADWDEFGTLSDVNLAGPYFLTAHFVSLLAKSASPSVIFNASTLGMSKTSYVTPPTCTFLHLITQDIFVSAQACRACV